jgi:hypothetical protein
VTAAAAVGERVVGVLVGAGAAIVGGDVTIVALLVGARVGGSVSGATDGDEVFLKTP